MRKLLFSLTLLIISGGIANAQYIYTHVEQDGTELTKLGTAQYDVSATINPQVVFDSGKAVMTYKNQTIATLPMSDNGELVVEFETKKSASELNTITKTPTTSAPYVTIYSPFPLCLLTSEGGVYAPTYDEATNTLTLSSDNKMAQYQTAPPETPLTICGTTESVKFEFYMYGTQNFTKESALSGSSLKVAKPTDGKVFTYGIGKDGPHKGEYGLFLYTGSYVNPGLAYLKTTSSQDAKFISLTLNDNEATAIKGIKTNGEDKGVSKYIENGRMVIRKAGKKFNINGQEVK